MKLDAEQRRRLEEIKSLKADNAYLIGSQDAYRCLRRIEKIGEGASRFSALIGEYLEQKGLPITYEPLPRRVFGLHSAINNEICYVRSDDSVFEQFYHPIIRALRYSMFPIFERDERSQDALNLYKSFFVDANKKRIMHDSEFSQVFERVMRLYADISLGGVVELPESIQNTIYRERDWERIMSESNFSLRMAELAQAYQSNIEISDNLADKLARENGINKIDQRRHFLAKLIDEWSKGDNAKRIYSVCVETQSEIIGSLISLREMLEKFDGSLVDDLDPEKDGNLESHEPQHLLYWIMIDVRSAQDSENDYIDLQRDRPEIESELGKLMRRATLIRDALIMDRNWIRKYLSS